MTSFLENFLDCETFAAGTVSDGVWIGDFKATFLQVFAVIEHRTADEKRALWIDDQMNILRWHKNVPLLGSIDQIHDVLQTRAAAADYLEAQRALWPALFLKQRR